MGEIGARLQAQQVVALDERYFGAGALVTALKRQCLAADPHFRLDQPRSLTQERKVADVPLLDDVVSRSARRCIGGKPVIFRNLPGDVGVGDVLVGLEAVLQPQLHQLVLREHHRLRFAALAIIRFDGADRPLEHGMRLVGRTDAHLQPLAEIEDSAVEVPLPLLGVRLLLAPPGGKPGGEPLHPVDVLVDLQADERNRKAPLPFAVEEKDRCIRVEQVSVHFPVAV